MAGRAIIKRDWTDDKRVLLRKGVAEKLQQARDQLQSGQNFRVLDGWRPWPLQKAAAEDARRQIVEAHPDWSVTQIDTQLQMMAPPSRVVPLFGSHRYGGAVDLTIIDSQGNDLDMGVPVNYVTGPEAALLYYEHLDSLTEAEKIVRQNRRLLIRAMESAGFDPYLPEFWHWSHMADIG
ncbi:MAG: M15 family metallopeptidase [Anaerolineales bacterium]